ncbi:MAG: hypothetical protein OES69_15895 [Myxococcales bacterium]|nr:hypothetical protein [Myxococcales bacterium]MDH3845425.1 hypothetical protein [Myxococcales bacterium]
MPTSTQAVAVALFVNCVTGAAKAAAFLLTGSTAIMAELLHSVADITTQVFVPTASLAIQEPLSADRQDYLRVTGRKHLYFLQKLGPCSATSVGPCGPYEALCVLS